jgi:hypothetical protein
MQTSVFLTSNSVEFPDDPQNFIDTKLTDSSEGTTLLVDGSSTTKTFTFEADENSNICISRVSFILVCDFLMIQKVKFGAIDELTNGIVLKVTKYGTTTTLKTIKRTEDLLSFPNLDSVLDRNGNKDFLRFHYGFGKGLILRKNTTDKIELDIKDDLTSSKFQYFEANVFGVKE